MPIAVNTRFAPRVSSSALQGLNAKPATAPVNRGRVARLRGETFQTPGEWPSHSARIPVSSINRFIVTDS